MQKNNAYVNKLVDTVDAKQRLLERFFFFLPTAGQDKENKIQYTSLYV